MKSPNKITRRDFTLTAAALPLLPHALLAATGATYQIVTPDQPTPIEQQAAEKLQHFLSQLPNTNPSIVKEQDHPTTPAIYIGQTKYAKTQNIPTNLKEDGYSFHPVGENLIVLGGSGKGTLYAVYSLLEFWGFRMYTPTAIDLSKSPTLALPKFHFAIPEIEYRSTSYRDTRDPQYMEWHGLNSRSDWGLFVHTFNELIPPDRYGKTHPEYFSLINGTRLPGTQLCLSNPDLANVMIENLRAKIAEKPAATYWSVSQNDNDQYCRCGPCTELNTKYGNVPSGSILFFTNQVAKAFPAKIISTLAYWYSRTPPQNIKAEPNVNIMLCNIESRRQGPVYETDPAFSKDLTNWGQLASNILIWDYNIQFSNLVSPFPNLHTIKPNIDFYTSHNVNSLFMQANGQGGGEFAGLRAYLISKLMWNPKADDSAIIDDYLNGFYGPAGPHIRQYIDRQRASLISSGLKLNIFGSPEDAKDSYLSLEMMMIYKMIFDEAEKSVASDPKLLTRVKAARLPIQYAEIQIGRNEVDTPRSMFAHTSDGKAYAKPAMKTLVADFVAGCKQDGVTRLRERSTPPDEYLASYTRIFTNMDTAQHAASLGKTITPATLPEGGAPSAQKLTDGLFGSFESWSAPDINWVAWKGQHLDLVLDLGAPRDIHSITMDFLNAQAQPDWNLLVLPKYVTYATSTDGVAYTTPIKVDNPHNPNPKENPDVARIPFQPFRADLAGQARYIKVHAESLLAMPSWHIRAGQPAWLYTDQIVVL